MEFHHVRLKSFLRKSTELTFSCYSAAARLFEPCEQGRRGHPFDVRRNLSQLRPMQRVPYHKVKSGMLFEIEMICECLLIELGDASCRFTKQDRYTLI